jgi:hypothetical protein
LQTSLSSGTGSDWYLGKEKATEIEAKNGDTIN